MIGSGEVAGERAQTVAFQRHRALPQLTVRQSLELAAVVKVVGHDSTDGRVSGLAARGGSRPANSNREPVQERQAGGHG